MERTGWPAQVSCPWEVAVTGLIGDRVERLELTASGNHTVVRVILPEGSHWGGDVHIDFTGAPAAQFDLQSRSGNIRNPSQPKVSQVLERPPACAVGSTSAICPPKPTVTGRSGTARSAGARRRPVHGTDRVAAGFFVSL